jgi:hypothetical protein
MRVIFPNFSFFSLGREIPQLVFSTCETFRAAIKRWFTTFLFWTIARLRAVKNFLLHALRSEGNRSIETTWRTLVGSVGEETYETDGSYLLAVAQGDAYLAHHDEMKN